MKLWSVVLVALMAVVHVDAEAKRMGGGKSVGQQSNNVTQRESVWRRGASPRWRRHEQRSCRQACGACCRCSTCCRAQEAPGAPCWVAWPQAWALRGWPALWAWVPGLAQFLMIALLALAVRLR